MAVELPEKCREAIEGLVRLVYQVFMHRTRARRATKYVTEVVKSLQGVTQTLDRLVDNIGRLSDMWFDAVSQELVGMRNFAITAETAIVVCLEENARLEDVLVRIDTLLDMLEEVEVKIEKEEKAKAETKVEEEEKAKAQT